MSWAVWYQKGSTITYTNQPIFFCSCTFHGTELESGRKPWQRNFQWTKRHHKTLNAQIRNSKFAFSKPPKMATKRPSWTSTFVAFQILAVMLLSKMYSTCAKLEWSGGDRGDLLRKLAVFVVTAFWCLVLCGSVKARPWTFASPPTIIFQGKSEMRIFFKSNFPKKTCASWWLYVWMLYSHWLTFNDSSSPSFQTTPENSWISSCPFVSTSWTRDRSGVVAFNAVPPFCNQGHSSWPLQTCSR